jgi:hypothetical protein
MRGVNCRFARKEHSAMTQIIVDAALSNQLHDLKSPAELCDPSGRVLGHFVPASDLSEWECVPDDISDEELDRRAKADEKSYTTAEVVAYLEKL